MKTAESRITVPTGLRLYRPTESEEVQNVLQMFAAIAKEEGWQPGDYLQSVPAGEVHIALENEGEIIGGLQVVLPDSVGRLPCHTVWPDVKLSASTAHVTIIAVKPAYRGRIELFWALCQDMWCFCDDHNIKSIVLEVTPRMYAVYRRMGLPLQICGELTEHWGEPCYLTSIETIMVAGSVVMKARRSEVFRRLVLDALQPTTPCAIVETVASLAPVG